MNPKWRPIILGVLLASALGLIVDGFIEGRLIPVLGGTLYLCWGIYSWVTTKKVTTI